MDEKMEEIRSILRNGFPFWCDIPGVPDFMVGLEEPLRELKLMLLRHDTQVTVLSAPGGCGKTTLAKMLCNDAEVQGILMNCYNVDSFRNMLE
jgi:replication-associated recombination protein RarA